MKERKTQFLTKNIDEQRFSENGKLSFGLFIIWMVKKV